MAVINATVSELTANLDARVDAFKNRRLDDKTYPFVIVDAMVIDVRKDGVVRMMGMLIAYGVNHEGKREMLGLWLGDTESETTWSHLFQDLKTRGLKGVDLVVSDNHSGLVLALRKHFQAAAWQRCQVHFMRNVMGHAAKKDRKEIADHMKTILYAHEQKTARKLADEFIERYEDKHKKVVDCFQKGFESAITVLRYPAEYRQRLRTTNMAERVNEEIRRRQKVICIFPNENSAIRIVGALLADWHDEWISGKRYFDMENYWEWKKELAEKNTDDKIVQLKAK